MAQEINLGGTTYISSKRAAEKTGYTQDYIGQLARAGSISAQRVSGLWYVVEDSLRDYKSKADEFKPTPPPRPTDQMDLDSSVSFDGRDYVSAQRAAKLTGYNQDYVGQLARSEKILSRQIGNRWFVDREGIVEHKRYNDALLAAVQAESVGLSRTASNEEVLPHEERDLHFKYIEEVNQPVPSPIDEEETEATTVEAVESEETTEIPIRIMPMGDSEEESSERAYPPEKKKTARTTLGISGINIQGVLIPSIVSIVPILIFATMLFFGVINVTTLKGYIPDSVLESFSRTSEYSRDIK